LAWQREQAFLDRAYDDDQYGACARSSACYADARAQEIRSDANGVRGLYGLGYGLAGIGVGTLGAGILVKW
jgi:hypothetical protein